MILKAANPNGNDFSEYVQGLLITCGGCPGSTGQAFHSAREVFNFSWTGASFSLF